MSRLAPPCWPCSPWQRGLAPSAPLAGVCWRPAATDRRRCPFRRQTTPSRVLPCLRKRRCPLHQESAMESPVLSDRAATPRRGHTRDRRRPQLPHHRRILDARGVSACAGRAKAHNGHMMRAVLASSALVPLLAPPLVLMALPLLCTRLLMAAARVGHRRAACDPRRHADQPQAHLHKRHRGRGRVERARLRTAHASASVACAVRPGAAPPPQTLVMPLMRARHDSSTFALQPHRPAIRRKRQWRLLLRAIMAEAAAPLVVAQPRVQ